MIQAVARQPELRGELQGIQWLGFALTEAVVFYGLIGGLLAYVLVWAALLVQSSSDLLIKVVPGLMIWTIVCFLLTLFVLKRYAFGPIQKMLDERRDRIRRSIEEADNARDGGAQAARGASRADRPGARAGRGDPRRGAQDCRRTAAACQGGDRGRPAAPA